MQEYQLEIKQVVEYPRYRIYRQFIQGLMEYRSIRTSGGSGLFFFAVLCTYASCRTTYKRIDGISYTVYPGEWLCKTDEIAKWFRTRFKRQTISILDKLQKQHLIAYTRLGHGKLIKFKINGWRSFNTMPGYNAPCQKDTGFFFLPISTASEILNTGRCSEADIVLDLWMNTVYNEEQVHGSASAPVVYLRNGTGSPLADLADLSLRWHRTKVAVSRTLKKLEQQHYLALLAFPGQNGSVICLKDYLSSMFKISDVMIDKDEIAMSLNIKVNVQECSRPDATNTVPADTQLCISDVDFSIPKAHMKIVIGKVAEILAVSGLPCCGCTKAKYNLSPLSTTCGSVASPKSAFPFVERFNLEIACEGLKWVFLFELTLVSEKSKPLERSLR